MAQGGTLFLDEVGEMLPKTQVDLLRVLEQREVRRLGGERVVPLDVRLVVATHQDVDELVAKGRLREDLYYRLNVVPLRVPPLRERRTTSRCSSSTSWNGPGSATARARNRSRSPAPPCDPLRLLLAGQRPPAPQLMERLVVTVEGPVIHADDLPAEMRSWSHVPHQGGGTWPPSLNDAPPRRVVTLDAAVAEAEKAAILAALAECNHHRERTAQALGISVRTLHYKLNRHMMCIGLRSLRHLGVILQELADEPRGHCEAITSGLDG